VSPPAASAPTAIRRASLQAHASESSTTQKRVKKGEGKAIEKAAKRLLTASFDKRTPACCKPRRVAARSISADRYTTRKPASACIREQHNTEAGKKGQGKKTIEKEAKRLLT
jgi:hypothetical protein